MDSWLTSTFQISRIMLSCCHNNVIMNKDLFASLVSVLWGIYSDVEFLDQMQIRFLRFWRATILFSSTAAPFDIPTSSTQDFSLSTSLPRFILFSILLKSHINCYEVKPHCGLFCMFLLISNVEHPFLMCLLAIVFFVCSVVGLLVGLFCCWIVGVLYTRCTVCKYCLFSSLREAFLLLSALCEVRTELCVFDLFLLWLRLWN